jgi:hypothetical protein
MGGLMAHEVLSVWETGLNQGPVDRALTILAVSRDRRAHDEVAALPVGRRDALLLALREETFGPVLQSLATCPNCGERIEFPYTVRDLTLPDHSGGPEDVYEVDAGEAYHLHYRLPTSVDLRVIAGSADLEDARQELARRIILRAERDGVAVETVSLPEAVYGRLEEDIAERDRQADLEFDLTCPACDHRWEALFDIATFFWSEIAAEAKRLLRDVHTLARAYAWREADILALSPARRQYYLDLVS